MKLVNHFIGGKVYDAAPERTGRVFDPAAGEVSSEVAFATPQIVDEAVRDARRAYESWCETPLGKRARIMFTFRDLVDGRRRELAEILVSENGKVLSDAMGEVTRGLEVVEFACGIAQLVKGEYSENVSADVDSYAFRQPLGVVAGITPFNFPVMVPMWMHPVAIACGNTFVLKPSERVPSAANWMAQLFLEAGLPEGVFNVVHGDKVAVDALLSHPEIAAVSSVGSTPVARYIYETAAKKGKRVQALGGAKNHMVVLPDAEMDLAADAAVSAAYGSSGQRCMAVSAVITVGDAGDALIEKVRERISSLKVGPGLDEEAEMGPVVTGQAKERVLSYIDKGIDEGADLVVDGRGLQVDGHENGFFVGPCLFDNVTTDMTIYRDEIFGPVLVVVRAETFRDAIAMVNRNPYGNGASIFTDDGGAAREFQHEAQAGMVGINVPIPVPMAYYSFGGWKDSLFGDSHMHGVEGVRFYTRLKAVTSRWPDPEKRGVDLGFPSG